MEMYERVVKTYYDGLEEGKLLGRKCTSCGGIEFPPVFMCNDCGCAETEWVELSGKGEMFLFTAPAPMSTVPHIAETFGPYVYGCVRTVEGPDFNAVVLGVAPEIYDELREALPVPVKAKIAQRDGFKTLYFELDR
ncbi:MAG: zinc ribbon domain-containing protein [Bifidobacteriaceae bacterium]|jgi:acetyl-CoA C-acetyltransferase|nr:zinc ribbon domain-containing protein [Bifidobacteriaceae bacterium]